MTKEEIKKIYFKVCDLYPNFKPKDPQATFNTWVDHLSKYRAAEVEATLDRFIDNNPGGYAPNISNLIPSKEVGGFRGRIYTHEDFEEMERIALAEVMG